MESNRRSSKRMGVTKSKLLMPFYRAAKPPSPKPEPSSALTSLDLVAGQPVKLPPVGFIIVNQDQVYPAQKPKIAFVVPESGKVESFYGGAAEDEAVDAKAARYISSVRDRLRLEHMQL